MSLYYPNALVRLIQDLKDHSRGIVDPRKAKKNHQKGPHARKINSFFGIEEISPNATEESFNDSDATS